MPKPLFRTISSHAFLVRYDKQSITADGDGGTRGGETTGCGHSQGDRTSLKVEASPTKARPRAQGETSSGQLDPKGHRGRWCLTRQTLCTRCKNPRVGGIGENLSHTRRRSRSSTTADSLDPMSRRSQITPVVCRSSTKLPLQDVVQKKQIRRDTEVGGTHCAWALYIT